ncbi:MAG: hypothetical protein K1X64_16085 [Myxococcaceae bacterium]|nr:hypothetical protein [Myxococcaceae bacterium]
MMPKTVKSTHVNRPHVGKARLTAPVVPKTVISAIKAITEISYAEPKVQLEKISGSPFIGNMSGPYFFRKVFGVGNPKGGILKIIEADYATFSPAPKGKEGIPLENQKKLEQNIVRESHFPFPKTKVSDFQLGPNSKNVDWFEFSIDGGPTQFRRGAGLYDAKTKKVLQIVTARRGTFEG